MCKKILKSWNNGFLINIFEQILIQKTQSFLYTECFHTRNTSIWKGWLCIHGCLLMFLPHSGDCSEFYIGTGLLQSLFMNTFLVMKKQTFIVRTLLFMSKNSMIASLFDYFQFITSDLFSKLNFDLETRRWIYFNLHYKNHSCIFSIYSDYLRFLIYFQIQDSKAVMFALPLLQHSNHTMDVRYIYCDPNCKWKLRKIIEIKHQFVQKNFLE